MKREPRRTAAPRLQADGAPWRTMTEADALAYLLEAERRRRDETEEPDGIADIREPKERARARKQWRRENGICGCGDPLDPAEPYVSCQRCRDRARRRRQSY